jgi:hypothetical protein
MRYVFFPGRRFDCFNVCFSLLATDVDTQSAEQAHINVGHPYNGEEAEQIATPVVQQQLEMREPDEECCDIMAETVFADEEIKEFPLQQRCANLALFLAKFSGFLEYLFMRHGPSNASDGNGQYEEPKDL